jgi:hypothetical protein
MYFDAENAKKERPSQQDLPAVPTSVHLAQKMGEGLG